MLLRIRIQNFKSIEDSEVRFGPLTCFIGHNAAGKSNLFDAVQFLSLLAEYEIHDALEAIRPALSGRMVAKSLFRNEQTIKPIGIEVDMLTPQMVTDAFNETVETSTTLLRYALKLGYRTQGRRIVVEQESLSHVKYSEYRDFVGFRTSQSFRESALVPGGRRGGPLISTRPSDGIIRLHGDAGSRGRPAPVGKSPSTVVGGTSTSDYPTVLAAKREMQSWRFLHFEPSAMRSPDSFGSDQHVGSAGGNLASTLRRLLTSEEHVANRFISRVRELGVDATQVDVQTEEALDQLSLRLKTAASSEWIYARHLSDGTLRFLALTLMLLDGESNSMLAIEEPENGIHPSRAEQLVRLLSDYAVDPAEPLDEFNPLRQVVINTHSSDVARQIRSDQAVFVEAVVGPGGEASAFRYVSPNWRENVSWSVDTAAKPLSDYKAFLGGAPVGAVDSEGRQLVIDVGTVT